MQRRQFGRYTIGLIFAPLANSISGCGSILYPERVGQARCGPLDWKVVALDGIGLFIFFVPGVVAFAVDYYNGTLFLPNSPGSAVGRKQNRAGSPVATTFRELHIPQAELDQGALETAVSDELARPVRLDDWTTRVARLSSINDFYRELDRVSRNPDAADIPSDVFGSNRHLS